MLNELTAAMEKAIDHMKVQFASLQAGRANATMVEDLQVESYGSIVPLKNVGNISCPDPKTIRIEPWDKSLVSVIEKAVISAEFGIMPQNFGDHLLLPIPPMTEERRKKLVKIIHEETENARISVRNARQEAMKFVKMQKDEGDISEDEQKKFEKQIQEKVDDKNKEIDELSKKKESDILTV